MKDGFFVRTSTNPATGGLELYIGERRNGKVFLAKRVDFIFEEIEENTEPKSTIHFTYEWRDEFMEALLLELDGKGYKTKKHEHLEGTLEATKYHLEDVRQLLKLKK